MANRLCILVCEDFQSEVASAIESEGFDDVVMAAYPTCCDPPGIGWDTLSQATRACASENDHICLLGGFCIAGLGDPPDNMKHCYRQELDRCFDLVVNEGIVGSHLGQGAHLLTPGWLARWQQNLEQWGFDQTSAKECFGESISRLVLLDTGVDTQSSEHLLEFAGFLGLPFETMPVGLDFLRLVLTKIVLEWRLEVRRNELSQVSAKANRQSAEHAMAFDLIGRLTGIMTEAQAIESILDLFAMMFAPGILAYLPMKDGEPGSVCSRPLHSVDRVVIRDDAIRFERVSDSHHAWTESGNGFILRVSHRDETLGLLEVDEIAFPQYKEYYLNLALNMVGVCGLAIDNARTYQEVKRAESALKEYSERLEEMVEERTKELRDAQDQLLRREKLAALGQMSAMVSHELRNPLGAILNAAYFLKMTVSDETSATTREFLDLIVEEVRSADRIISDLLDFTRTRTPNREDIVLSRLVTEVLAKRPPPEGVGVTTDIAPDLSPVYVDAHQMKQVLVNLVTNAYQAMAEGGTLTISAQPGEREVALSVADNGVGISEENRAKLFEPLYTTKTHGIGLGLMVVRNLVEANGGSIEVESEVGKGSTFRVRIPMAQKRRAQHD